MTPIIINNQWIQLEHITDAIFKPARAKPARLWITLTNNERQIILNGAAAEATWRQLRTVATFEFTEKSNQ